MNIKYDNIYNLDCIKGMKSMKNDSVTISLTSPPYNVGSRIISKKGVLKIYDEYSDDLNVDEYEKFITDVIKELIRVTKYYVFFNFQILSNNKLAYLNILHKFKKNIKDIIIWHKHPVAPAVQPTCLSSTFEFVVVFTKEKLAEKRTFERAFFNNRKKGQLNLNVIHGKTERQLYKEKHLATFPKYFARWFIEKFSTEGDIILDPFNGVGTTVTVAKQLNRKYLGFELSKKYCEITEKRLQQENLKNFFE